MNNIINSSEKIKNWHIYLIIVLTGIVVYGRNIFFSYTYLDDTILIVTNQPFIGNFSNLPKLFTTDVFISSSNAVIFYRPLLNVLFMAEAQVAHDQPLLYHLTNILLHLCCTILVYEVLKKFQKSIIISGIAALLFCIHPINASAVSWIPGRNDSLLTFFILSSFLLFLRTIETNKIFPLFGHIILMSAALLVKETAVMLPLLCFSFLYLVAEMRPSRKIQLSLIAGYLCSLAFWLLMRNLVSRTFEVTTTTNQISTWLRGLPGFLLYLGKIIFPFQYSVFPNLTDHSLIPGAISIILIAAFIYLSRRSNLKLIIWGFFWFILFLAPSIMSAAIFYEHRVYCALTGLLIAFVQFPFFYRIENYKRIGFAVTAIIIITFSSIAFLHAGHYKDRLNFASNALTTAPSVDLSYSCMASLFLDEGNDDSAENVIRQGLNRDPKMRLMHRMLGDIYARKHDYINAAKEYETSFKTEPLNLYTYVNYGKLQIELGNPDRAIRIWKRALQINPDHLLAYYYLANCYVHSKNDPDSAMIYVKELQKKGEPVLPELINAIEHHPNYHQLK